MPVTPLYAALLAILYLVLSVRTIKARRRGQVALGDGGNSLLQKAIRVHGNFAEYVPLGLLLMGFTEMLWGPATLLHLPGLLLLAGRIFHAYGVGQLREPLQYRILGMVMTFSAFLVCIVAIFAKYMTAL
ncbi:MAPEG family protein [Gallaecimonas mangrovi]|uniref:MAPEG family protein n=1 Tax=Gallaecimonas mangrovi TaxID=2291597 RepID=UPI000E204EF1|nr:MAPEG family protein [Gallaecimonas mangrovi]